MAQVCSHKDLSRANVGATAHGVASMRGMEHNRVPASSRLFSDPFAELLGANFGRSTANGKHSTIVVNYIGDTKIDQFFADNEPTMKIPQGLVDGVAVRTRKIDDETKKYINDASSPLQICVLGAGLDTRPWRIEDLDMNLKRIKYFEVDFPEMFEYKLPVLMEAKAVSQFEYISVSADLSVPGWVDKLTAAGFDVTIPTFWLLEGFTGYLTADEFHAVFDTMTALSAHGSRLVATFLTPITKCLTSMHRFTPEVPIDEVTKHAGWSGSQEEIHRIGVQYGRSLEGDTTMKGYHIVIADYAKL